MTKKHVINGNLFSFHKDNIKYRNAQVVKATLSSEHTVRIAGTNYIFKGGTEISFSTTGHVWIATLAHEHSVKVGKYERTFTFPADSEIIFYGTGEMIHNAILLKEQLVNIGENKYTIKGSVEFNHDGTVAHAFLTKEHDVKVGGKKYNFISPAKISFENGAVVSASLSKPHKATIADIPFRFKGSIDFHENGMIRGLKLVEDTKGKVNGKEITIKANHIEGADSNLGAEHPDVEFDENGNIIKIANKPPYWFSKD